MDDGNLVALKGACDVLDLFDIFTTVESIRLEDTLALAEELKGVQYFRHRELMRRWRGPSLQMFKRIFNRIVVEVPAVGIVIVG